MSREEMLALGVLFRSYHVRGPMGPRAVVVADSQVERVDRLLGILATADRPRRVFRKLEPARRWIERLPAQEPFFNKKARQSDWPGFSLDKGAFRRNWAWAASWG